MTEKKPKAKKQGRPTTIGSDAVAIYCRVEKELWRELWRVAAAQETTISELMRSAVRKVYRVGGAS